MINRRLLRVKVLQAYYAYIKRGKESLPLAEKELKHSIEKTYDLYILLLLLIVEIVDYAEAKIELAKEKKMPTSEDLNPNTIFLRNRYVSKLRDHPTFKSELEKRKISWVLYPELIRNIYREILESDIYQEYMSQAQSDWGKDKKIVSAIYSTIIAQSEQLDSCLEEQSIYWNDDLDFILGMIIKSIKKSKPEHLFVFDGKQVYKNTDDEYFALELLREVILKGGEYRVFIEKYLENWDIDRVALMDIIIMELAIAEMVNFAEIPVKVSLNEFIEISKDYSSKKSGTFINGILDKITDELRKQKRIVKKGKGLIGEIAT